MGNCCFKATAVPTDSLSSSSSSSSFTEEATNPATPSFGLEGMFDMQRLLGKGGEGETWLCTDVKTQELVAVKFIKRPLPPVLLPFVKREIEIQSVLGRLNCNLVRADDVVLTPSHLGLVMEYVDGGNMVSYVSKRQGRRQVSEDDKGLCLDEDEARYFFRQLIGAVDFCHRRQVAHRDLKLDNTLLNSMSPHRIKLCDFGFAKAFDSVHGVRCNTIGVGTPEYMSPELISSKAEEGYNGKKVDVWACGVLLYVMLFGKFPFDGVEDTHDTNTAYGLYGIWLQQIRGSWREQVKNAGDVEKISEECRDLLDRMFDMKSETRISTEMIKQHSWYLKPLPPKYQQALDSMAAEQDGMEPQAAAGSFPFSSPSADMLEVIIKQATAAGQPGEEPIRLPLAPSVSALKPTGCTTLPEGATDAGVADGVTTF